MRVGDWLAEGDAEDRKRQEECDRRDAHVYEVAYDALYALLPNCKNCGCY